MDEPETGRALTVKPRLPPLEPPKLDAVPTPRLRTWVGLTALLRPADKPPDVDELSEASLGRPSSATPQA